jgi:hypothetical protein
MDLCVVDSVEKDLPPGFTGGGLRCGHVVALTAAGEALVDFPGNPGGPYQARSIVALDLPELGSAPLPVLLFFEGPTAREPIILGVIRDTIRHRATPGTSTPTSSGLRREILAGGRTIQVEADQEIVLRCGASSVSLRRDGKIVLKGVEIVSRASEANKIKGAVVKIN